MAITIGRGRDRDEEKQRAGSQKDVVEKNRCKPTFVTTRRFRGRNRFHQFWHDFHEVIKTRRMVDGENPKWRKEDSVRNGW